MTKMREEFEVWCCERGFTLKPAETNCGVLIDGEYGHPRVQLAWESWKASRAALCVEIPKTGEASSFGNYVVFDTELVQEILDNAGVSYK